MPRMDVDWKRPENRNFDKKVEFVKIRRTLDVPFNDAHDELSEAYYNFWRRGLSHPWQGYDVQATPEESKRLFDYLHGLIFEKQLVALWNANEKLPTYEKYDMYDLRYKRDDSGQVRTDRYRAAIDNINLLKLAGYDITIDVPVIVSIGE